MHNITLEGKKCMPESYKKVSVSTDKILMVFFLISVGRQKLNSGRIIVVLTNMLNGQTQCKDNRNCQLLEIQNVLGNQTLK